MKKNRYRKYLTPNFRKEKYQTIMLVVLINTIGLIFTFGLACAPPDTLYPTEQGFLRVSGIEFKSQSIPDNTKSAFTYYLKNEDEMYVQWSEFILSAAKNEDAICTSNVFVNDDNCLVVDLCNGISSNGNLDMIGEFDLQIVAFIDFMRSSTPEGILSGENIKPTKGCINLESETAIFSPDKSGVYQFFSPLAKQENIVGKTNGEINLYVIGTDQNPTQTVTFDLRKERIESVDYWRWLMPDDPIWSNNFSKNLKVTNIKILENGNQVRPSRILFLPQFEGQVSGHGQEIDNQCFVNPNTPTDHSITLNECRKSPNSNSAVEMNKITTPVYTQGEPPDLLNWFVEFNQNQGSEDASNFNALQIEFTIEAIN